MKSNPTLSVLKSVLGSKVVSYHSVFARALRSVPAGVMLSQGFFWQENANFKELKEIDGVRYFTATAAEWYDATGVTDDQQLTARDVLRSSGFWMEKRSGLPAKLYFHIDLDILVSVIYGFLENGKQVSVDTRHKNREITRASDGKYSQPVSVNPGNNTIKVESIKESLESTYGEATADEQKNDFQKPKKEKAPQIPAAPPRLRFSETDYAGDADAFWAEIQQRFSAVDPQADFHHYHQRCLEWSDAKSATSNDWPRIAAKFILDDARRGDLRILQPVTKTTTRHDSNTDNPSIGKPSQQPFIDRDSVIERAAAIASRIRSKQQSGYRGRGG